MIHSGVLVQVLVHDVAVLRSHIVRVLGCGREQPFSSYYNPLCVYSTFSKGRCRYKKQEKNTFLLLVQLLYHSIFYRRNDFTAYGSVTYATTMAQSTVTAVIDSS